MSNQELATIIDEAHKDFVKKAYALAVESSLLGETNAISRFGTALKKATEVRNQILKSL
jgi:hypothetical protein